MAKSFKTIRGLASEIAKREGKKSQTSIGNIREILGIISEFIYDGGNGAYNVLYWNGRARSKRKKK